MADDEHVYDHPGTKTSRVWTYFGFKKMKVGPPNKENLDMSSAICRLCQKVYANKGNTTNLMAHLKGAHNELMLNEGKVGPKVLQPKINQALSVATPASFMPQLPAQRVQQLNNTLLKLIVGKVLPLSLVDSPFFKKLIGDLDPRYRIPSRKTVVQMLNGKREEVKHKLTLEMKNSANVAITHDGWTSRAQESYQTVTAHFINAEWELKSAVLETKKITGSHTGEAIACSLRETQAEWFLPAFPIATTDNAANERKAFEILGWERFGCYGHRINLAVKNALGIPETGKLLGKGRKLVTFFHQSSSATDLLKKHQAIQLSDKQQHKLIQDCPTRWNSSLAMLSRLLEQTPSIMAMVHDPQIGKAASEAIKNYSYTFQEQGVLEKVVDLLSPFEKATVILCAEKSPTLPKVLPILSKLQRYTKLVETDCPTIRKLKTILAQQMETRSTDTTMVTLASFLNPGTKDLPFCSDEERQSARTLLLSTLEESETSYVVVKKEKKDGEASVEPAHLEPDPILPVDPNAPLEALQTSDDAEDVIATSSKRKLCDMEDWLDDVVCCGTSQIPQQTMISQEVSNYLAAAGPNSGETMLEWWKKNQIFFPRLSKLANKFLAVPASSVPSERVFSLAGELVDKKRARLSPQNINTVIFLNKNMTDYWK